jgi:hypothetical protein
MFDVVSDLDDGFNSLPICNDAQRFKAFLNLKDIDRFLSRAAKCDVATWVNLGVDCLFDENLVGAIWRESRNFSLNSRRIPADTLRTADRALREFLER